MTERLARTGEALAVAATLAVATIVAIIGHRAATEPDAGAAATVGVATAVAVGALVWSTAGLVVHLATERRRPGLRVADQGDCPEASFTTLVRVGEEPLEITRTTVLLAAAAGPTVVVGVGDLPQELRCLGVPTAVGDDAADALARALALVDTPAVLLVSGRAVPIAESCRRAAAMLDDDIGWVSGWTAPFSRDRFVENGREEVASALASSSRRYGLVTWAPDATVVSTHLLRDRPLECDRPWGAWLRMLAAEGWRGRPFDGPLTRRAAPVDAAAYWPDDVARTWARSADLARATAVGPARARVLAALLLLRELFAVPLSALLSLPFFVSDVVPGRALIAVAVLVCALAVARWAALQVGLGRPLHPGSDVTAALHSTPASLLAVGAAITRRTRPPRRTSDRPLVWAALVLTAVTGVRLVDATGSRPSGAVIALALAMLAALWAFGMAALSQRNWARSTYRVPVELAMSDGHARFRTRNGSPSGLAVTVPVDYDTPAHGTLDVTIELDDGSEVRSSATVTGRRRRGAVDVIGLALTLTDEGRAAWVAQLDRSAGGLGVRRSEGRNGLDDIDLSVPDPVDGPRGSPPRVRRFADRLVVVLAGLVTVAVGVALVLVLFGFHPFVIRSGSMEPTIAVGDVVIAEEAVAADLRVGDVATIASTASTASTAPGGTVTHRVIGVTRSSEGLAVRTQGDANDVGELTRLAPDAPVGIVRSTVPWIGRPANSLRGATTWIAAGVAAAAAAAAFRRRRRR